MGTKQTLKAGSLLMLAAVIILGIFYIVFKTDAETLKVMGGFMALMVTGILGVIKSDKIKKIIDKLTEKFEKLENGQKIVSEKVNNFTMRFENIEEQEIVWKNALKEIETGQAESEERQLYIQSHIQHINEIDKLCIDIDADTNDYLEKRVNLNPKLETFLIEFNEGISRIIKIQYKRGFKKFRSDYFKSKFINNLNSCLKASFLNKKLQGQLKKDIEASICKYTKDVRLEINNNDNGERLQNIIDLTLRLTEKINERSVELSTKIKTT